MDVSLSDKIDRLAKWNRFWLGSWILLLLAWGGTRFVYSLGDRLYRPRIHWQISGEIRMGALIDRPFVVTHLVRHSTPELEKVVATLPHPLAVTDSRGATLSKLEVKKLVWRDITGQVAPAPPVGSKIEALYCWPQVTQ